MLDVERTSNFIRYAKIIVDSVPDESGKTITQTPRSVWALGLTLQSFWKFKSILLLVMNKNNRHG